MDYSIFNDPSLYEDGCRKPSRFLPATMEFLSFMSRCKQLGFSDEEICKLSIGLAEKFLKGAAGNGA
ncbi:hypothetical protein X747_24790 [Mesorhizobium sp. LNJC384A00]|uniref:hypothetical protein n=1 Tax=Mesorhizobium sp. LNJC384A00 TaxID=1287268 RepID=UPI0003CEFAF1|nr:hypothetical protein [Mesorhizobium sp. LNJC384A00]ESY37886.1 hypothetical protein X747_24790 [Mesorhizobium sp. LNJC384A00]